MMLVMVKKPSCPDLSTLTNAEKDDLILSLLARLEALESTMRKDSHNCHHQMDLPRRRDPCEKFQAIRSAAKSVTKEQRSSKLRSRLKRCATH